MTKRDWLEMKRKQKNWSQQEVAEKVGVDRTYIGMLESGKRDPSVKVAQSLGGVLDFDWKFFFEDQCDISSQLARDEQAASTA